MSGDFYSEAETRPPQQREEELLKALPAFVSAAKQNTSAYAEILRDINPQDINSRAALAQVPAVDKSELIAAQEQSPPFAGMECFDVAAPRRFFMSPGPIAECDFDMRDYWRTAAPLYAAGLRRGMVLHNSFSYHFTPAGHMCEDGAAALGATVFAAGTGNGEQQARALARFGAHMYCGTPDFLRVILTHADDAGISAPTLTMASFSGGYFSPELREYYQSRNIAAKQWYGTADCGAIAYETVSGAPLVVVENMLVEVVDPETRMPLPAGEKGEVLITNFNPALPLLRFSLGDLSAEVAGVSDCGRTNMRLAGWLGRCDAAVKVKGMFVHPAQIKRALARVPEVSRAQLVVESDAEGRDRMCLCCMADSHTDSLRAQIAAALREETKLGGDVQFVDSVDEPLIMDKRPPPEK